MTDIFSLPFPRKSRPNPNGHLDIGYPQNSSLKPQFKPQSIQETPSGGLYFNQNIKQFIGCHIIESNGTIERYTTSINLLVKNLNIELEDAIKTVSKSGLSSGKIFFKNYSEIESVSGFYLQESFFISTSQWKPYNIKEFENRKNNLIGITCSRYSRFGINTTTRKAYLIHHDKSSNISIFRLQDDQPKVEHSINLNQLIDINLNNYKQISEKPIFGIGYNNEDDTNYQESYSRYLESLSSSKQKSIDSMGYDKFPSFTAIFKPNERVLSIGTLKSLNSSDINLKLENGGSIINHTISGWDGFQGSMIGQIIDSENVDKGLEVRVYGMFSGGRLDSEYNDMIRFTEDVIQDIKNVVKSFGTVEED